MTNLKESITNGFLKKPELPTCIQGELRSDKIAISNQLVNSFAEESCSKINQLREKNEQSIQTKGFVIVGFNEKRFQTD